MIKDQHISGAPSGRFGGAAKLGSSPVFYLVYLLFYFAPWLFAPVTVFDVVAAVVAIGLFLPVYFWAYQKGTPRYIAAAFFMEALAFATVSFNGMQGTFHIYAAVQAGFQRPVRTAIALLMVLTAIHVLLGILFERSWYETGFVLVFGLIIGFSMVATAEEWSQQRHKERGLLLDKQLATIEERERIARDLHDLLGQTLTMVALKAEVASKLIDVDPARARQEIEETRDEARSALQTIRQTVMDMVFTTVPIEVRHAETSLSAADIELTVQGAVPDLDDEQNKAVGLVLREAVTNIIRHSGATKAEIVFERVDASYKIAVRDNGTVGELALGSGLTGAQNRLAAIGGVVSFDTSSGMALEMKFPSTSK